MKKYAKEKSKIWNFRKKIPQKLAKKVDFRKILDPISDFSTKESFKICDPRISWYSFGTKNHKMRGPPVYDELICLLWVEMINVLAYADLFFTPNYKWLGVTSLSCRYCFCLVSVNQCCHFLETYVACYLFFFNPFDFISSC